METTCGVFIFDSENNFLLCHPTGLNKHTWSIPKGLHDEGESYVQTAVRETYEETGIKLKTSDLTEIPGFFIYNNKPKRLKGFFTKVDRINTEKLKCISTFVHKKTLQTTYEVDKYIVTSNSELLPYPQLMLFYECKIFNYKNK
jgi:8-oxo-dGTP pyrophosphatase MutT (NUDIX family)